MEVDLAGREKLSKMARRMPSFNHFGAGVSDFDTHALYDWAETGSLNPAEA